MKENKTKERKKDSRTVVTNSVIPLVATCQAYLNI